VSSAEVRCGIGPCPSRGRRGTIRLTGLLRPKEKRLSGSALSTSRQALNVSVSRVRPTISACLVPSIEVLVEPCNESVPRGFGIPSLAVLHVCCVVRALPRISATRAFIAVHAVRVVTLIGGIQNIGPIGSTGAGVSR
jgi:hypothetical protein